MHKELVARLRPAAVVKSWFKSALCWPFVPLGKALIGPWFSLGDVPL